MCHLRASCWEPFCLFFYFCVYQRTGTSTVRKQQQQRKYKKDKMKNLLYTIYIILIGDLIYCKLILGPLITCVTSVARAREGDCQCLLCTYVLVGLCVVEFTLRTDGWLMIFITFNREMIIVLYIRTAVIHSHKNSPKRNTVVHLTFFCFCHFSCSRTSSHLSQRISLNYHAIAIIAYLFSF